MIRPVKKRDSQSSSSVDVSSFSTSHSSCLSLCFKAARYSVVLIYTFLCLHYQTTWWAKKLWLNTTHKLYVLTSQTVNPVLLLWWISQIAAIIRNHVTIWTCSKRDFTLVVSFGSNNVKPLHFLLVFCVLSALISVFISAWYILYRTQVNRICFVQILTQACPIYFETTKQTQAHTQKKTLTDIYNCIHGYCRLGNREKAWSLVCYLQRRGTETL